VKDEEGVVVAADVIVSWEREREREGGRERERGREGMRHLFDTSFDRWICASLSLLFLSLPLSLAVSVDDVIYLILWHHGRTRIRLRYPNETAP
jgi:hypothetical protein